MKTKWTASLLKWFNTHQREMPWRSNPTPYYVWISEVMLQQTQVSTVIPYFNRFIKEFPTIESLAKAELQNVLKLWEGLGYYTRARNLHKTAKQIVSDFDSKFPRTYNDLQKLTGIGPYIAAAVASIAFGKPLPVVDGNVLRVFARFWGIEDDIRDQKVRVELFNRLTPFIATEDPSSFNQAIMELGALLCKPREPLCKKCPIQNQCVAFKQNKTDMLPFKSKKAPVPHHDISVGIIWKGDRILIGKRRESGMLGGMWEFPGGKREKKETLEQAVIRETCEETSLNVKPISKYCTVKHAYSHFKITLTAWECELVSGQEQPNANDELRWVAVDELENFPFPTANKKVIEAIVSKHKELSCR